MTYEKPMNMTLTARRILCRKESGDGYSESHSILGDYLGKVWAVIFNTLGLDFYKLPPDEQKILKKILSKAPNIKNSPFNFRRKRK